MRHALERALAGESDEALRLDAPSERIVGR